jgi:hypothetical protein
MRSLIPPFAALAALLCAGSAAAQEADPLETPVAVASGEEAELRELTTDRPDVTESPFTVDAGHFQLETTLFGHTRTRAAAGEPAADIYEFGTSNLRIGLADNFEIGIVWQPYGIVDPRGGGGSERGIGSVDLRAKVNLWGNDGGTTALALLPYVTLPTDDDNGIGAGEVGFGLIVPLAIDLGGQFGLGLNGAANVVRSEAGAGHDASGLVSASLARAWTGRLGSYAEVVWEFAREDPRGDIFTLGTGMTLALGEDWQLDAGITIGTTRAADALAGFIGISARF